MIKIYHNEKPLFMMPDESKAVHVIACIQIMKELKGLPDGHIELTDTKGRDEVIKLFTEQI